MWEKFLPQGNAIREALTPTKQDYISYKRYIFIGFVWQVLSVFRFKFLDILFFFRVKRKKAGHGDLAVNY